MVLQFKKITRRFKSDREGATAVIYALCLLPILLLIGFSIDASRTVTAKRQMQTSLDAAVLAGAREFLDQAALPMSARQTAGENMVSSYFVEDVKTAGHALGTPVLNITISDLGNVNATANAPLSMMFGSLFNRPTVSLEADSGAQAGDSRKVEVILALDNTASMFDSGRFTIMRQAAKGFVNTMFDETPADGLMAVGVVPWASVVNINSEQPGSWNPSATGNSAPPVYGSAKTPKSAFENRRKYLSEPESTNGYTSGLMKEQFAPVDWRGCVRSAANERRVSAGGVVSSSLTDASVPGMRWHASWLEPELQTWWQPPVGWKPNPNPNPGPQKPSPPKPVVPGPQGFLNLTSPENLMNATLAIPSSYAFRCTQSSWQGGYQGQRNVYLNKSQACAAGWLEPVDEFAEACVSDPTEFEYFNKGGKACAWQQDIFPWDEIKPISGPNMNCPTAMLGLSGDRGQVIDKLDHMYPVQGGTQADIGLMWGLRALSPRSSWSNFFGATGAAKPKAFSDPTTRKVMILLTDGKNEAPYHYEGYYGCREGTDRGRAGECWRAPGVKSLKRDSLDALMLDSCEAIRGAYNVELYTIAVDVSDSKATGLLKSCAGDDSRAFNITAGELDTTFKAIAARELRLTH